MVSEQARGAWDPNDEWRECNKERLTIHRD
jgi:hypothetical protein